MFRDRWARGLRYHSLQLLGALLSSLLRNIMMPRLLLHLGRPTLHRLRFRFLNCKGFHIRFGTEAKPIQRLVAQTGGHLAKSLEVRMICCWDRNSGLFP